MTDKLQTIFFGETLERQQIFTQRKPYAVTFFTNVGQHLWEKPQAFRFLICLWGPLKLMDYRKETKLRVGNLEKKRNSNEDLMPDGNEEKKFIGIHAMITKDEYQTAKRELGPVPSKSSSLA
uniref:Uncharacterized protein n=1 Tax=Romanomermis culicivorax TaxID=13658 RepID=A0A915J2X1_ROMCU